jgi:hypothetical protein
LKELGDGVQGALSFAVAGGQLDVNGATAEPGALVAFLGARWEAAYVLLPASAVVAQVRRFERIQKEGRHGDVTLYANG